MYCIPPVTLAHEHSEHSPMPEVHKYRSIAAQTDPMFPIYRLLILSAARSEAKSRAHLLPVMIYRQVPSRQVPDTVQSLRNCLPSGTLPA